jgi:hypothetical protein
VKIWSKIIRRLASYKSSNPKTTVNTFQTKGGKIHLFSGPELLARLRTVADSIGSDELGFTSDQLGLHSARSGAAMAMFLAGVPVFTIMLLGRWSSDAFLRYIRKQVREFSSGISSKMILNENFYTVPTDTLDDNRHPDPPINNTMRNKTGLYFNEAIRPLIRAFQ